MFNENQVDLVVKYMFLEQQCKKQKEVISRAVKYIDNLRDESAEIYDRHFWNDDTFKCYVVSTKHDEDIKYKEPERIEEFSFNKNNTLIE